MLNPQMVFLIATISGFYGLKPGELSLPGMRRFFAELHRLVLVPIESLAYPRMRPIVRVGVDQEM
jgi:hypothetical protein